MQKRSLLGIAFTGLLFASSFGQTDRIPLLVGEKIILTSNLLDQDREILVSLPKDYEEGDERYPVHFILDAEITFEAYAGVVHLMHMADEIPDAIVVGISNIDRSYDLDFMRNGVNFLEFITKELIPLVDSTYRTLDERLIAGYSLAGNYVVYTLFKGTDYFDRFLSGSPYGLYLFYPQLNQFPEEYAEPKVVYTSMGRADKQEQVGPFLEFCGELEKMSIKGFDFHYDILPNRNHDTNILPNWHDGLAYLYKDWVSERN